jgi:predicted transglutaminase-like cysteine proteinase
MRRRRKHTWSLLAFSLLASPIVAAAELPLCRRMDLQISQLQAPPSQYTDFCLRHPEACILEGAEVLALTPDTRALLAEVNRAVNAEVTFMSDPDCWGVEELWSFPDTGVGDCEDYALEKRRRLVAAGLPSAALTMAIVYDREGYFLHAVLLAETESGSFVLDNFSDDLMCWDVPPWRWDLRERSGGLWARFVRP